MPEQVPSLVAEGVVGTVPGAGDEVVLGRPDTGGGDEAPTVSQFYIKDDFGDDSVQTRTAQDRGIILAPDRPTAGDALVSVERPSWDVDGTPTAANDELELNSGDAVATFSEVVVGNWSTVIRTDTPGNHLTNFSIINSGGGYTSSGTAQPTNGYDFLITDLNTSFNLQRVDSGSSTTLISGNWAGDSVQHTFRCDRARGGSFELFYDGASEGTTTDNNYNTTDEVKVSQSDSVSHYDSIEVGV